MNRFRALSVCMLMLLVFSWTGMAAEPSTEWSRTLAGERISSLRDIAPLSDGSYVIFGTKTNLDGISQMVLLKFDGHGDLLWENAYGDGDSEMAWSMLVRQDGGYLLAGTRTELRGASRSTVIYWVSETGALENTVNRPYSDRGDLLYPLIFESREGVFTELSTWVSTEGNGIDYRTTVLSQGVILRDFRCLAFDSSVLTDAIVFEDGSTLFLAYDESSEGFTVQANDTTSCLISLPKKGSCEWTQPITGVGRAMARTPDNSLIIVGSFQGRSYLAKASTSGELLWTQTYGQDCPNFGLAVEATDDGGAVVTGRMHSCNNTSGAFVFRVDSEGTLLWSRVLGQTFDIGVSIHSTSDSGYILGINCASDGYGCEGVRIIKLAPELE